MLQTLSDVEEREELVKLLIVPSISFDKELVSSEDEEDDM